MRITKLILLTTINRTQDHADEKCISCYKLLLSLCLKCHVSVFVNKNLTLFYPIANNMSSLFYELSRGTQNLFSTITEEKT
jgi:hypothetical protein